MTGGGDLEDKGITLEPRNPGITRRDALRRGAVVGGALIWAAPVVQTVGMQAAKAQATPLCGRMTGGGNEPGVDKVSRYGFELNCSTALGPNNLEVAFVYQDQEVNFHLDTLTSVVCSDNPSITPNPPRADFDTMEGTGTGHLTGPGAPGCTDDNSASIEFKLVDGGEGRGAVDFISFKITCGSTVILDTSGSPFGGNIQAHGNKRC